MSYPKIREIFLSKLRSQVYDALKNVPFIESWGFADRWDLANSIVESKMDDIDKYLETRDVTVSRADNAILEIFKTILLPEIRKLRI